MAATAEKIVLRRDDCSIRAAVIRVLDGEIPLIEEVWGARDERRACLLTVLRKQRAALFTPAKLDQHLVTENTARPTLVVALDVSPKGIRLTHDEPLAKHGIVWFNGSRDGPARIVVEKRWTRVREDFSDHMSGFRILGVVD